MPPAAAVARRAAPVTRVLASLWSWLVLGVLVVLWLPLLAVLRVVTAPFDPARYWTGLAFRKLAVVHERLNPLWSVDITGPRPADPRLPYVAVSNHESFVDILLIAHLPWEMKWLSKEEMFKIPGVGWLMRLAGDVPVRRGSSSSGTEALEACGRRLDERVSVMVFPEGTRSKSGELAPFRDGAFRLAIDRQVPVLPMAVRGTRGALQKHSWLLDRAHLELELLEPVDTKGLTPADVPALRDEVRRRIADALDARAA